MKAFHTAIAIILICAFAAPAFGSKEFVQRRKERIEFAEKQWTKPEKVTLNIHYRVPVIEVLGYLAANYDDNQKLIDVSKTLRPIANRVKQLAGDTYGGRTFPAELEAETQQMRRQMMQDVSAIYGSKVTQAVESYLDRKYSSLNRGIFSPIK